MSIAVIKPGLLDTVRDAGRTGYSKWGINPGGAMDRAALALGNALVGNDGQSPAIEMHFPAAVLRFHTSALIALTGADFKCQVNGINIPCWKPVLIPTGATMQFTGVRSGQRTYLAVRGFDPPQWLGSASTHLKAGLDGVTGRALSAGDTLAVLSKDVRTDSVRPLPWSVNSGPFYITDERIFFTRGRDWDLLTPDAQERFGSEIAVRALSNRMGFFLSHAPLAYRDYAEKITAPVSFGTIQLLKDGSTVVLMADHQITGGYPVIGHISSAHLPTLSQMALMKRFRLSPVTAETSEKLLLSQQQEIQKTRRSCLEKLTAWYAQH